MKKKIALIAVILGLGGIGFTHVLADSSDIPIDAAHFPDELFRAFVLTGSAVNEDGFIIKIDENGDGKLEANEVERVWEIFTTPAEESIKGIEYFTNLHSLTIDSVQNVEADLSKNTNLEKLDVGRNKTVDKLTIGKLPNLKELSLLSGTVLPVPEIIKDLPSLESYSDYSYQSNHVELSFSHNPHLKFLEINRGGYSSIDVSKNPELTYLTAPSGGLSTIDLSHNPELETLSLSDNPIEEINLTGLSKLHYLLLAYCDLNHLDLSSLTELQGLFISGNNLETLDLSHQKELETVYAESNKLTEVSFPTETNIRTLDLQNNLLKEFSAKCFKKLNRLDIRYNRLSSLDVTEVPELEELAAQGNQLTGIDLSNNLNLKKISLASNQLLPKNLILPASNVIEMLLGNNQKVTVPLQKDGESYYVNLVDLFGENFSSDQVDRPTGWLISKKKGTLTYLGIGKPESLTISYQFSPNVSISNDVIFSN
jgi:hypothetical protein